MNVTENRDLLFKAIAAAQGEFTTVDKSASNPHFKSKFAPLDSIIEMIRPILPKHGLSVVQFTDIPEGGNGVIIETVITHDSGQYISGRLFMPTVKQDPQGYGSSITYGRRYALGAALGIVSDEDVDGNQQEGAERQTKAQQQPAKPTTPPADIDPESAGYHTRIQAALKSIYGDDKNAALAKVEEMTTFTPKGKTEPVKGVRNFLTLKGDRAKFLAEKLEKLVKASDAPPEKCDKCGLTLTKEGVCPDPSCTPF
jgi:hypothetical protein